MIRTRAGSLLFRALASRAGNFDKLLARNYLKPAHDSDLLDFWKKSACQPGRYLSNFTCPPNYPPLAQNRCYGPEIINYIIRCTTTAAYQTDWKTTHSFNILKPNFEDDSSNTS